MAIATAATMLASCAALSWADDNRTKANALLVRAAKLGRAGDHKQAIVTFKAAESLYPRAANVCNIALSYVRLQQWDRAHLYLDSCRARWTRDQSIPLPQWVDRRTREALSNLRTGNYAAVRFTATPAATRLSVSVFEADETFTTPRVIWLPKGTLTVTASLPGYTTLTATRSINADDGWALELERVAKPPKKQQPTPPKSVVQPKPTPTPTPMANDAPPSSTVPILISAAGAALLVAGGIAHGFAFDIRQDAKTFSPGEDFNTRLETFRDRRMIAIGLYAAGAVVTGVGTLLWLRSRRTQSESALRLGASAWNSGGSVWLQWRN